MPVEQWENCFVDLESARCIKVRKNSEKFGILILNLARRYKTQISKNVKRTAFEDITYFAGAKLLF